MYGNGYSMAIVLDHRSTATSLTGNPSIFTKATILKSIEIICFDDIFQRQKGRKNTSDLGGGNLLSILFIS